MSSRFRLPGLLVLAVVLAACGDDSEPVDPPVPPAPIPAAEPAAATPPREPPPVAAPEPAPIDPAAATPAPTPPEPVPAVPEPLPTPEPVQPAAPVEPPAAVPGPAAPAPTPPAAAEPAVAPLGAAEPAVDIALRARIAEVDPAAAAGFAAPCLICHVAEPGMAGRLGPNLFEVVGRTIAADPAFAYSPALAALGTAGATWTYERLDAFLANPQAAVPETRMTFAGIADPAERAGTIAWLRSLAAEPAPLAAGVRPEGRVGTATVFSAEQADAGAVAYVREGCSRCHGDTLRGVVDVRGEDNGGDGPSLRSANFHLHFYGGSIAELFRYVQDRMPPDARGTLPDETVVDLIAFILRANGFAPGETLPADVTALEAIGFWQ